MRDNLATSKYLDVIISNGFNILNQEPTRIMEMAQTCLGHFIIKDVHHQKLHLLYNQGFSDHTRAEQKIYIKEIKNESKVSFTDTSFIKKDKHVQQFNTELEKQLQSCNPQ